MVANKKSLGLGFGTLLMFLVADITLCEAKLSLGSGVLYLATRLNTSADGIYIDYCHKVLLDLGRCESFCRAYVDKKNLPKVTSTSDIITKDHMLMLLDDLRHHNATLVHTFNGGRDKMSEVGCSLRCPLPHCLQPESLYYCDIETDLIPKLENLIRVLHRDLGEVMTGVALDQVKVENYAAMDHVTRSLNNLLTAWRVREQTFVTQELIAQATGNV